MWLFNKNKKEKQEVKEPTKAEKFKVLEEKKSLLDKEVNQMRIEHKEYIATKNDLITKAITEGADVEDVINKNQPEQQKDANKPIPEDMIEKIGFWTKTAQKAIFLLCIGAIMAMIVYAFTITKNPDSTQQVKNMVVYMVLMGMLLFVMILINVGTLTGIEIWKRFIYKFKYRRGIYVNGLIAMKSGVYKRFFIKKEDTGEIRINSKPYVPNPKLLFILDGVPSYLYREGNPDPMNIWETKLSNKFSCAEMDNVMYSAGTFDFKTWLQKNLMIFLIGVGATVIFALAACITGYMVYTMLKKGQYNPQPMIDGCKQIFGIIGNQTAMAIQSTTNGIPVPTPTG